MNVEILKLHEHQEFINDAMRILNHEWPRSESARMHSLTDSRDDLPCCLVLVSNDNQSVIGHSKLTKVHGQPQSAIIENVVIEKARRGCRYGRKLMELSENYAYNQGYQHIHLSTHDKCKFYEHLGYQYSSPVSPIRANAKLLSPEQFSVLQSHFGEKVDNIESSVKTTPENNEHSNMDEQNATVKTTFTPSSLNMKLEDLNNCAPRPPLPPPPPPPPLSSPMISSKQPEKQYWMIKHL